MNKEILLNGINKENFYTSEIPSLKWNSSLWGQGICPFHADTRPSFFANRVTGIFHCKGCDKRGSIFDFYMETHGVDFKTALYELAKQAGISEDKKKIIKSYDYLNESGTLLFQTVRYEPKDFKQRRPDPNNQGKWIYNLQDIQLIPYNLPEVKNSKYAFIVEGEKDVETLKELGLVASCNPMGSGKWRPEYNSYFKDKRVAIIPDNDKPGRDHALTIAKNLKGMAESVKIIEFPDLSEKGDISDWIEARKGRDAEIIKKELIKIIKQISEWEETEKDTLSFLRKGSDLINLECNVEWVIDKLIPKQSIVLLHGKGGIGKTWLSLVIADAVSKGNPFMGLNSQQISVVFVDFENSLPVLVERVKKIKASEVLFWHGTNEIRPPKLDKEEWEQYKSLPVSLLIFDTLRASQGQDENDSRHMAFVMSRLKELRDIGFTIILLHHTPKSNDRTYKGSTAIMDLADHVLSLHKVRKKSLEDISDDENEEDCLYRFGTKDKTRYEPFHIFLDFDHEKGFVIAPDPDEEDMREIHSLIVELKKAIGELPIQSRVIEKVKEELELSKSKIARLLRKGEGKYWNSQKIPERKNAKVFEPISVFQFPNTIYNQKTEKLPETVNQFTNNNLPDNAYQSLDNIEFASFPESVQKTGKQEVIDLKYEEVEIVE